MLMRKAKLLFLSIPESHLHLHTYIYNCNASFPDFLHLLPPEGSDEGRAGQGRALPSPSVTQQ